MDNRSVLIRRTLSANAAVTFLFGALLLVDRGLVARLLGIESATPVLVAGFICVACAPVLLVAARKPDLGPRQVAGLIAVDGAWVAASLVVAVIAPLTGVGRALIVGQAALVGVFMALEAAGLRRLQLPMAAHPAAAGRRRGSWRMVP